MKFWKIILFSACCVSSAQASDSDGKVIDYWVHYFHDSFLFTVENQVGRPDCATLGGGRFVVDTRTEKGKAVASAVMAAKAGGLSIHAAGEGTCNYYSDSEDLRWIRVY